MTGGNNAPVFTHSLNRGRMLGATCKRPLQVPGATDNIKQGQSMKARHYITVKCEPIAIPKIVPPSMNEIELGASTYGNPVSRGTRYTIALNLSRTALVNEDLRYPPGFVNAMLDRETRALSFQLYGDLIADLNDVISSAHNHGDYETAQKADAIIGKITNAFTGGGPAMQWLGTDRPEGL